MLRRKYLRLRPCTLAWLVLLILSTASFILGSGRTGTLFITSILVITLVKGQLIIRYFMGLRRVRLLWQAIMGTYLVTIGVIIGLAYFAH